MKKLIASALVSCVLATPITATATERYTTTEQIMDETVILGGAFLKVTYETVVRNHNGEIVGKGEREAVFPAMSDGSVAKTTPVLMQTVSGNYATLLLPTSMLEEAVKRATLASNIVRVVEVDHRPIQQTEFATYRGFHFSTGGFVLDTPWNTLDGVQEVNVMNYTNQQPFRDVEKSRWSEKAIYTLASDGIVHGVGEGNFDPEGAVSRAAFLKMLSGVVGATKQTNTTPIPKDVEQDAPWAKEAVKQIKSAIDSSTPGAFDQIFGSSSLFRPNESITRAQAAKILAYFVLPASVGTAGSSWPFIDWPATENVKPLIDQGILSGTSSNQFSPEDTLSREQMAAIILRLRYIN